MRCNLSPWPPHYLGMPVDLLACLPRTRKIPCRADLSGWYRSATWLLPFALGCQADINGPGPTAAEPGPSGGSSSAGASGTGGAPQGGQGSNVGGTTGLPAGAAGAPVNAGSGGTAGTDSPPTPACTTQVAPRAPLRRITRFEYNNTVRDLLNVTTSPANSLPGEEQGNGFGNDADALGVSRLLVDGYRTVAQQVAAQVTVDATAVDALTTCSPTVVGEAACRQTFLTSYLARAFRRPAAAEEVASYDATFATGQMLGGDFASGVRAVVERSLQSAQFLYRVELGEPFDVALNLGRPSGYEMATRLSYLIWGSMPDPALFDAAAEGRLADKAGVLAEARRMLDDPRARESLRHFHAMLLGTGGLDHLERDAGYYPTFKPGMGALFREETERFLDDVIWSGAGDLATVFTAPYTFVNGALATFYGIQGVTGDAFQKVSLDVTRRAGLLTQASILTLTTPGSRTDPVVRGKWIYTKILCGTVEDPPLNVPKLPDPVPGQSVRERLTMHRQDPACQGCHAVMDPLGLPFEHFDGVGLWRDTDNGAAIDVSGEVPEIDVAGPFNGVVELAQKVAQSGDVRSCYAGRYLTYAYGRSITASDECSRTAVETTFEQSVGNIKELMLAVTQTDGFLFRPLAAPAQ